ncbi:MAG: amidohydrolase family protein, partial [bacterium]
LLDSLPNIHVEMGAILAELGRQPLNAHNWIVKHQDRVLMGKDIYSPEEYTYYFRCLETRDEYFDYYRKRHAHWKMYGFELPDAALKKVYYKNALRLVPGLNAAQFPQ